MTVFKTYDYIISQSSRNNQANMRKLWISGARNNHCKTRIKCLLHFSYTRAVALRNVLQWLFLALVRNAKNSLFVVIFVFVSFQHRLESRLIRVRAWIPAYAGMTEGGCKVSGLDAVQQRNAPNKETSLEGRADVVNRDKNGCHQNTHTKT